MKKTKPPSTKLHADAIEATALGLLAQREHTQFELCRKLTQRGYLTEEIQPVLDKLAQAGWQSDQRFLEQYIDERAGKGYGPTRIFQELQQRGLSSKDIHLALRTCEVNWAQQLNRAYLKKFTSQERVDLKEKARRIRFLQYRGFDLAQISQLLEVE